MSLNVSALADWSNSTAGEMIVRSVYEGQTTSILPVKTGVKHSTPLNIFDVDLVIQNGTCVSTPSGSFNATQRVITVTQRTSYDGLCLDQLNPKYLGISSLERGSYNETFELASVYTDQIVNQMKKLDDQFLWSDGQFGTFTSSSTAGVVVPNDATGSFTSTNALSKLDALIENIPAEVADRDDWTIWMSTANFRKVIVALREANNYYYDMNSPEQRTGILQLQYPFANGIKVVGTVGISGNRIALMPDAYAVVGTDLLSDVDNFQLWYDINADQLKHRLKHKLGAQVAFPEYIISNDGAL